MPKFITNQTIPFDDGSLAPKTTTTATTDTTTSAPTTDTKFVPTVEDVYTTIKYINKETGEIRDFYFYQGNPVTPIPEGFVPYNEATDETVDDLESTQVESTSVRDTGGGGRNTINIEPPEPVDWSTYSADELKAAYEQNKKTRMALTALGLVNPLIAIFGRTTATMQEKKKLEERIAELQTRLDEKKEIEEANNQPVVIQNNVNDNKQTQVNNANSTVSIQKNTQMTDPVLFALMDDGATI